MKSKTRFRIAIVNHADRGTPEHWAPQVSVRRSRAIRQCAKLRAAGNPWAMLFMEDMLGNLRPIPLKMPALADAGRYRSSSATAGVSITDDEPLPRQLIKTRETLGEIVVDIIRAQATRNADAA